MFVVNVRDRSWCMMYSLTFFMSGVSTWVVGGNASDFHLHFWLPSTTTSISGTVQSYLFPFVARRRSRFSDFQLGRSLYEPDRSTTTSLYKFDKVNFRCHSFELVTFLASLLLLVTNPTNLYQPGVSVLQLCPREVQYHEKTQSWKSRPWTMLCCFLTVCHCWLHAAAFPERPSCIFHTHGFLSRSFVDLFDQYCFYCLFLPFCFCICALLCSCNIDLKCQTSV